MLYKEVMMEKIVERSILYDFYGELLTEHQKNIYEDFVLNDLSLGEIANDNNISRQGVHDLIKRCDKMLEDYENKLHLIEKFNFAKANIEQIHNLVKKCKASGDTGLIDDIERLSNNILDNL